MAYRSRVGKALFIIGLALIISSFAGSIEYGTGSDVSYGTYKGKLVRAAGDIRFEVETRNQSLFSLYIMRFNDFTKMIRQNGSMEGCRLVLSFENITAHNGTLHVLVPGWFAIFTTPTQEGVAHIHISVNKLKPSTGIFFPGVLSTSVGILITMHCSFFRKKTR
ncbi:MAG: hypothetical protein GF309_03485 [Candidatus Lokiarchaeota archaeon]|nr:hypothetical protein [Candidatus Lokiarchaeota archaeon]